MSYGFRRSPRSQISASKRAPSSIDEPKRFNCRLPIPRTVVGDAQYGSPVKFGADRLEERNCPIALHARELSFSHPMTQTPVQVTAPLPEEWRTLGLDFDQ